MKRYQELFLVIILFLLSVPIQLIVALILRLQLGAPVMFRQVRAGKNGSNIVVPKYRTMTDARDASGQLLPDALRQTRLTRLIRRLRFDELPQLWLVLRGQMALVGPRPLLPVTVADFGALGELRNSVAPGVTGWAQVNGNTRLSNTEKLALDLWYVGHRSPGLDLRVMAETVLVPLRGEIRDPDRLRDATEWVRARFGGVLEQAGAA
ncbi:sugar transferase [Paracoccus xiamenensis]|uniref:sugar transferase n=1 Tax=Paracoccus xiamenensis TaxID=2714901 RepID=UPI0014096A66|nr:sugar transferase [Paracoccus xiamenensis]NHF73094.1 sugar transferase [Paracoccus xiamenensis]